MAAAYERIWKYVQGQISELSPEIAQSFVKEAWERILHSKETWSFLDVSNAVVATVDQIITGTVEVTEDSASVVADATAKAVLDAIGQAALIGRQFRVSQTVFPVYTITAYDSGTGTITLDRVYLEESNAATEYIIYQTYYPVPDANFSHWLSVFDPEESRTLHLFNSREELNRFDPQRAVTDAPWAVVSYQYGTINSGLATEEEVPFYEWYPAPTSKRGYICSYRKMTQPFDKDNQRLPRTVSELLVKQGALIRAYEWCEANKGRSGFEHLKFTNWSLLISRREPEYNVLLNRAHVQDSNVYQGDILPNYLQDVDFGFGADYLQSHAPYGPG